jgi:hypothetical protein
VRLEFGHFGCVYSNTLSGKEGTGDPGSTMPSR